MNALVYIALLTTPIEFDTINIVIMTLVMAVFIVVIIVNLIINRRLKLATKRVQNVTNIMQHAMEIGGIFVVKVSLPNSQVVNVQGRLLPSEGMGYDDFVSHIHPDDRQQFTGFIEDLSQRVKTKDECRLRWHNSLPPATHHSPSTVVWQHMKISAVNEGRTVPCDVMCTLTDETDIVTDQQREQDLGERYRLIFERSVVGLSFYDSKGMMLAANENMRQMFHFQPGRDPFFYDTSIFSRPPLREMVNLNNPVELHFCTKVTLPERGINRYMEIRFNPLFDDVGQLQNISVAVDDITEDREMYLNIKRNEQDMRKANAAIQQYETELQYLMDNCNMRVWRTSFRDHEVTFYRGLSEYERKMSLEEFRTYFLEPDDTRLSDFDEPELHFDKPATLLRRMYSLFHEPGSIEWNMLDYMPVYDTEGKIEGCIGTIRNMTALMNKQEQLKEETRRANESSHLKSAFLANMTHEIRTPLNAIVGFSDLLPEIDDQKEKQEIIRIIRNNCDMLLRLINDILSPLTNTQHPSLITHHPSPLTIQPADVDFAQAFDDICQTLAQRVQPPVRFIKDNPYTTLPTHLENGRIQQVITNFVTNAVKYTHEGHIRLGYQVTPDGGGSLTFHQTGIYIYCEDTGVGIPKDKQASVFERFVKLDDFVQGTGLGLAICKSIAERYGGQIGVTSEGLGHGSTFWLWIPCPLPTLKSQTSNLKSQTSNLKSE